MEGGLGDRVGGGGFEELIDQGQALVDVFAGREWEAVEVLVHDVDVESFEAWSGIARSAGNVVGGY